MRHLLATARFPLPWRSALLLALTAVLSLACSSPTPPPAPQPAPPLAPLPAPTLGQWIWSRADLPLFEKARLHHPQLRAGLFVSALSVKQGAITQTLALSPRAAGEVPRALVIRLEASLHALWDHRSEAALAAEIDERLRRLLNAADPARAISEIQLDYDCPSRRLEAWARVIHRLRQSSLLNRQVLITSLPTHLTQPAFRQTLLLEVDGHILQVFDTGLTWSAERAQALAKQLASLERPFYIALGAFERRDAQQVTTHLDWFSSVPLFATLPGYRGVWIFPGGQEWLPLLPRLPAG